MNRCALSLLLGSCDGYTNITEPWRNRYFTSSSFLGFPKDDRNLFNKWWRFTGIGGDRVIPSCISLSRGGTIYGIYFPFPYPETESDTPITGTAYANDGNCKGKVLSVDVALCPGGFYVYRPLEHPHYNTGFVTYHYECNPSSCGPLSQCVGNGGCICIKGYEIPPKFLPSTDSYGCTVVPTPKDHTTVPVWMGSVQQIQNHRLEGPTNAKILTSALMMSVVMMGPVRTTLELITVNAIKAFTLYQTQPHFAKISTSAVRHRVYVVNKLCVLMYRGPSIVLVLMNFTLQLESFGRRVSHFVKEVSGVGPLARSIRVSSAGDGETGNAILGISESLVSAMVSPNVSQTRKSVQTSTVDLSLRAIGPGSHDNSSVLLSAKGQTMDINLQSLANNNNGSAAAAFMTLNGMESLLSHQYFKTENKTEMYSDVFTVILPSINNTNLTEPVNFTIQHKKKVPESGIVTCVYWEDKHKNNEEAGKEGETMGWSVNGCWVAYSNENYTVCSCSHLSTFALIMQIGEPPPEDPFLDWLNRICVTVGLFFFALAILTFLLCSWNPKINNTARLHLCLNLSLSHLLLLWSDRYVEHELACKAMAGILHFLIIASFVWMQLEALQLYLLVRRLTKVQVIQRDGLPKPLLYLIGYSVPFVIVGISALVYSGGYGANEAQVREEYIRWLTCSCGKERALEKDAPSVSEDLDKSEKQTGQIDSANQSVLASPQQTEYLNNHWQLWYLLQMFLRIPIDYHDTT
ncbi:hypothetical protein PAMP_009326 [Pampus punctatissimus]